MKLVIYAAYNYTYRNRNRNRTFTSCFYILAFTSGDIIFYKFLELHSTLSKKQLLSQIFSF